MGLVKVLCNKWIPKYHVRLPEWEYFKYNIQIDYQDHGIVVGIDIKDMNLEHLLEDVEKMDNIFNLNK